MLISWLFFFLFVCLFVFLTTVFLYILRIGLEVSRLIKFFFYILFYFLTLQYCIGFAIYQHESATGIHVFPILNPPPSSLPTPSPWAVPVHQPQASSIVHRTWTGDSFHIWYYTCFNAILPNHPTLSLSHRVQTSGFTLGFCSSGECPPPSFSLFNFNFSTFIPLLAFPTVLFPLKLIFNVYKSSSTSI